jgi:hypothetical protein
MRKNASAIVPSSEGTGDDLSDDQKAEFTHLHDKVEVKRGYDNYC